MRRILLLLTLLISSPVYAATYCIDFTSGSDSNTGLAGSGTDCTDPGTSPWKNYTKAEAATFVCGDNIFWKKGEEWLLTSGKLDINSTCDTPGQYITFDSYGTGAAPKLNGIQEISGWTVAGNWTDYTATVPNAWYITVSDPRRLWLDGTEAKEAQAVTGGSIPVSADFPWFSGTVNGTSGRLLIRTVSGANPATVFSSVKGLAGATFVILSQGKNGLLVQNMHIEGGFNAGIGLEGVKDSVFRFNNYTKWSKGFYASDLGTDGTPSENIETYFNTYDAEFSVAPGYDDMNGVNDAIQFRDGVLTSEIHDEDILDAAHEAIGLDASSCTGVCYAGVKYNYVHHNSCRIVNAFSGRGITLIGLAGYLQYNEIAYNYIDGMRDTDKIAGEYNHVHHNLQTNHQSQPDYVVSNGSDTSGFCWRFDRVVSGQASANNVFEYNLCYNSESPCFNTHQKSGSGVVSSNISRNNIFINCGTNPIEPNNTDVCMNLETGANVGANTYRNNLCYNSSGTTNIRRASVNYSMAAFNALDGTLTPDDDIGNNIASNPLFVDGAGGDYHLTASSPAIDSGFLSTGELDYEGFPTCIGIGCDIGIYEFGFSAGVIGVELRGVKKT